MREPDPTSPHAEYDRNVARSERRAAWWRRAGRITFYILGVVLALLLAGITAAGTIDLGQPRYWGTFTQTDCEPRTKGGCRSIGVWISDDRTIVKTDVYLDTWPNDDGTTRASYQPTALISGEANNVVQAEATTGFAPLVTGIAFIVWVIIVLGYAALWGDIEIAEPQRRRRPSPRNSDARGLDRRQYRDYLRGQARR